VTDSRRAKICVSGQVERAASNPAVTASACSHGSNNQVCVLSSLKPWSDRPAQLNSTQLVSWVTTVNQALWSLNWPVELSWVWLGNVITLQTQLDKNCDHCENSINSTQLVSWVTTANQALWSLNWSAEWPQRIRCCGHSVDQLSWVKSADVMTVKTQSTQLSWPTEWPQVLWSLSWPVESSWV